MTNFPLEAGLTAALWDLFAFDGPVDLALACLYRQLPLEDLRVQHFKNAVKTRQSRAWWPRSAPCPDLAIITPSNAEGISDVLAVIEIKARAATNWSYLSTAAVLPELPGAVASDTTAAYFGKSPRDPEKITQTDLYRSRQWWHARDEVDLIDPDQVLWLLFDTRGRTATDALRESYAPDAWLSIDLKVFAANLRESRSTTPLTAAHHDTIAVVLWHIDQAPGGNLATVTPDVPRPATSPSVDDIAMDDAERIDSDTELLPA